jgi:hypothetical protein
LNLIFITDETFTKSKGNLMPISKTATWVQTCDGFALGTEKIKLCIFLNSILRAH